MDERIVVVYGPALASYDFGPEHPLQPSRHQLTIELLEALGWLDDPRISFEEPRAATITELLRVHSYPYLQAVERAQDIALGMTPPVDLGQYGLGTEDNPLFDSIHDAPALYTGATIQAMAAVLDGTAIHAYNPAGGLHHAMRSRAAGFCVYNDSAAAIAMALERGHRIAYLDLDAHHGDGVQSIFYDEPRVLTVSVHESGRFLFPGTGAIDETGSGEARGSCVNIPLPPTAGDETILEILAHVVEPALRAFAPTIVVTQTGCDTHHADPLTDLNATLALYPRMGESLHRMVHEVSDGRWLIVGGGGYDPADVTPRAWAAFIGAVLGHETAYVSLPESWKEASRKSGGSPPQHLLDDEGPCTAPPARDELVRLLQQVEDTALSELTLRQVGK